MARPDRNKKSEKRASIRDKARQAADQKEKGGGGLDTLKDIPRDVEFFKPKMGRGNKGKNRFSIVPYVVSIDNHPFQEKGELWHECTYWRHKVGVGTDSKSFICIAKTAQAEGKRCPICDYRAELIKNGEDPKLTDALKPKQRQLFNILDHDDEGKGIQLFEISPYQFGFMLDEEDKAQADDFPDRFYGDSMDGLIVLARFNEESFNGNKFPEIARIDFEEREDLDESIVTDEAVDLDACLRILDFEDLKEKFFEFGGAEEEDDEEPPPEKEEKRTRTSRNKPEKEPEEKKTTRRERNKSPEEEPEPEPEPEGDENDCPEGFEFGFDCDAHDECDNCDRWDDCRDRADEIEAQAKEEKTSRRGKK